MNLFEPYLRVPYLDKGRTYEGCDCWGLVRMIYKEELGVDLPSYADISAHDAKEITKAIKDGETVPDVGFWRILGKDERVAPFDLVLMKWLGSRVVGHIGIVTDDFRVLHTEEFTGPVIVNFDNPAILRRVVKYGRWKHA